MSGGGPRGGGRNNYADYKSFNPNGSSEPPPLRRPALTATQVRAAAKLGFSDKYLPSSMAGHNNGSTNGRGHSHSSASGGDNSGFPEIGEFCLEDYVDGGQQNNSYQQQYQQQVEEEGLLPPLRRPHVNEIPADTLAVILKDERCEDILALNAHNQQHPQNTDRSHLTSSTPPVTQSSRPQSHYYQSQPPPPTASSLLQQNTPVPQNYNIMQTPPRTNNTGSAKSSTSTSSSSQAPRQSNIRVHLSPNAKEFVPMSSGPGASSSSLMTTQEESELMQAVAQFQLQNQPDLIDFNNQQQQASYVEEQPCGDDSSDYVLSTITDSIMDLTNHPANFARTSKAVTEVLKNFCVDLDTLNVVVTLLVEQSISNPNFCYSGARLAEVLIKNNIAVGNSTFKSILLTRCQEVFLPCIANMKSDPQVLLRCRGLLMYFGELYINIKIDVLGLGVLEMMDNLIKDHAHDNIKCVFQILKLVGWDLENSKNTKVKTHFEQLMKDMSYLCLASGDIQPQTKSLLDALFELKNKKWNRGDDEPAESVKSYGSSSSSSGAPTGNLSHNIYELPDSDDDFDDECILLDDEPDEVQLAYEEFLKSVN